MRFFAIPRELKTLQRGSIAFVLFLLCVSGYSQSRAVPQTVQIALPTLSDGLGWKQPKYYTTIQTTDIDGDGQSEVLARWIDGLNIYRFENGTLVRHSRITALSDNAGFYEPSWYSTIRAAVLEPKLGQADVIAREGDGIHVFRYDRDKHTWGEIGTDVHLRPFADTDGGGTDWTQAKYYSTIQLADVTGDGAAELVGRGRSGMQVWQWDAGDQSWKQILAGGTLGDDQGFDQEPYYSTIQLIDVDHDGVAELIARAPDGIRTYKWTNAGWADISSNGPFQDDPEFLSSKRYKSVHATVDATGRAWLYGVVDGFGGAGTGSIEVHRWNQNRWQAVRTIPLPGSGWDRESQSATLIAADIQGDATPEFLIRGPRGLYAFDVKGRSLPTLSRSFTDAQGWNLLEQSGTLKTAKAILTENGGSRNRTLVLARGSKGLEAYKFTTQWAAAADSNFLQYCSNFKTDTSVACQSYKLISMAADGVDDIRSTYALNTNTANTFKGYERAANTIMNPFSPPSAAIFEAVRTQMKKEFDYGITIEGWFFNNNAVLKDNYDQGPSLLDDAAGDVDLSTSTSVLSKWLEFAGDIASSIAGALPDDGGSISLIISVFDDTYSAVSSPGGDINQEVEQIRTSLVTQRQNYTIGEAQQLTSYLTDYSKMKQMGQDPGAGGYDWSKASSDVVAEAKIAGEHGMQINFYRTLLPAKWQVVWCNDNTEAGPECSSDFTKDKYNCTYGTRPGGFFPAENAYIYAGLFASVNWSLLDRLTGPISSAAPENLNAIWYMMLLGGDLGWDLPQTEYTDAFGDTAHRPDPNLAFSQIEHGYNGKSANCSGNGSFNGIVSTSQTLGARLSVAQQNAAHISAKDAKEIIEDIRALKLDAEFASPDYEAAIDLTSPLREAVKLIEPARTRRLKGQVGEVSATTPTHLMELFIRRTQSLTAQLGESHAKHLTTDAYCLIGEMEGQEESGKGCQSSERRWNH